MLEITTERPAASSAAHLAKTDNVTQRQGSVMNVTRVAMVTTVLLNAQLIVTAHVINSMGNVMPVKITSTEIGVIKTVPYTVRTDHVISPPGTVLPARMDSMAPSAWYSVVILVMEAVTKPQVTAAVILDILDPNASFHVQLTVLPVYARKIQGTVLTAARIKHFMDQCATGSVLVQTNVIKMELVISQPQQH